MIGKIPRAGRGFTGLVSYLMNGKAGTKDPNRVEWSHTRNLVSPDPELAPTQMRATAAKSRRCEKPVYHLVISWAASETPTPMSMLEIGETTLRDLQLLDHQAVFFSHKDTDHKHLHIVVNRVNPETHKAWHASKDYERVEKSLARQALERGYTPVPGRHNAPELAASMPRRAKDGEFQLAKQHRLPRLDRWSDLEIISRRHQLAPMFESATSWRDLTNRLAEAHLLLHRKGQGIIIADATGYMKLSELHKDIRLRGLEQRYCQTFEQYAQDPDAHHATVSMNPVDDRSTPETTFLVNANLASEVQEAAVKPVADEDPAEPSHISGLHGGTRRTPGVDRARDQPDANSANTDDAAPSAGISRMEEDNKELPSSLDEARARLDAAQHALTLAYALGSLVSSASLSHAQDDVRRAQEELRVLLTLRDRVEGELKQSLTALVEPDDDRDVDEEEEEHSR